MTDQTDIVDRLRAFIRDDYEPPRPKTAFLMQEAAAEITRLRAEADQLRSVMIAAAEEIQAHWPAHCDAEGYGPANLMRRLEEGIPSQYAYTAGDFERLRAEAEALRKDAERYRWLLAEHERIDPMAAIVWKWKCERSSSEWVNSASPQSINEHIDTQMHAALAVTTKEQKAAQQSAQGEAVAWVTQADVNEARSLILEATATDLLSGDRRVVKSDRYTVYGWLCKAANCLVGDVPPAPEAPVVKWPEQMKMEPLRGDEPVQDQECAARYVQGWNNALAACKRASAPAAPAQAVPLTDEQIQRVWQDQGGVARPGWIYSFARAIERAHGIVPKAAQETKA